MSTAEVTLHVGIGTFRPVSVEDLSQHHMHYEWCEFPEATAMALNNLRSSKGRIVSVGTTSLRTLESAWKNRPEGSIGFHAWQGETNLFVRPPYDFHSADALLTNFHLPKSTLLMLVAAFAGLELVLEAYHLAIADRYRFFSYGDAMLIL
jgi:S-adenosylmethionine:tRNA ribosyltransferase-isomerase